MDTYIYPPLESSKKRHQSDLKQHSHFCQYLTLYINQLFMFDFAAQKKLLEPILKHPSNHICADCDSRSPTWASLDFGVFLCSNCSGAHRALGPTITRVKSANLDLWQQEWLENMVLGNDQINAYWESDLTFKSKKPKMGASPEEIRRYIFDKYVKKKYVKNPLEDDPLHAYKTGSAQDNQEKQEQKIQKQTNVQLNQKPNITKNTQTSQVVNNAAKREVSLLDFDVELTAPPVNTNVPQNHNEQQFTSYTECGTSFTNQTSKDSFVDFNTLINSHKQGQPQGQMHHSMSTQAVFQHSLYSNNPQYYNQPPAYNQLNTQFHQNYPSFTHQNYFQHPYPPQGHYSPAQLPVNQSNLIGQNNINRNIWS